MRRYEVRLTPSAMEQISDAVSYVRDDLGAPQAAARLLEELEEAVMGLASLPNRFHAVDAEPLLSAGVRRMNVRASQGDRSFDSLGASHAHAQVA